MLGISIIVCTYNGKSRLEPTLNSIINQKFANSFNCELIVVNNSSTDNTLLWVINFLKSASVKICWKAVNEDIPGLSNARLRGLNEAKYDWVLFCDDDNQLYPDYLYQGSLILKQNERIGALGGFGIPIFESVKPEWWDRYSHSFAVGPQADNDGQLLAKVSEVYGAGCFFRKEPFLKLFTNGFKPIMTDRLGKSLVSGGDVEWCLVLQVIGYQIWYSSKLRFYHYMPVSRLNWEYYLKLKSAISIGYAKLFAYNFILKYKHHSRIMFILIYIISFCKCLIAYILFKIKISFFNKYDFYEKSLGSVVIKNKVKSYIENYKNSLCTYKSIKSIESRYFI